MHLTALCATACDNPNRKTQVDLAQDFLQYIESDTLCYRVEHPREMVALQEKLWDPLMEWFCQTYNVSIAATQTIIGPTVPEATLGEVFTQMATSQTCVTAQHDLRQKGTCNQLSNDPCILFMLCMFKRSSNAIYCVFLR